MDRKKPYTTQVVLVCHMAPLKNVDCRYFSEGLCESMLDVKLLRGANCGNEVKDACCYACELMEQCEIRCENPERKEENDKDLATEIYLKAGYDVLSKAIMIVGAILLFVGMCFILLFALAGVEESLGTSLIWLIPLVLTPLGVLLISFAAVRLMRARITKNQIL